jgi:hypothetical protein
MNKPRVKRGPGPKGKLTQATYRKKALRFLLTDFEKRCAYCLDPDDFRHPSLTHVDHFDCKLHGRKRHQYKNLMLGCAACNMSKHDKPVVNPFDKRQRLLNCTEENEFPQHIRETEDGQWEPITPAAEYHLAAIGLRESCHKAKRAERRKMANRIFSLLTHAIRYESHNPAGLHNQVISTVRDILTLLDKFPPLITDNGVITIRDWLIAQGLDGKLLEAPGTRQDSTPAPPGQQTIMPLHGKQSRGW